MKKTLFSLFLLLGASSAYFLFPTQQAEMMPLPTELAPGQDESGAFKQHREAFFRQMHRAAPGTNWEAMDQSTRLEKAQARMASLKEGSHKRGLNDQFSKDTLANGQLTAHWREIGSKNQSGRILTAEYDITTDRLFLASSGGNIWVGNRTGSNWEVRNDLLQIKSIERLSLIPMINGKRLIASTTEWGQNQFVYSDDEGYTWQSASGFGGVESWGALVRSVVVPDAQHSIYTLTFEWDYTVWERITTIYKSTDQGLNFAQIASFSDATFGNSNNFDLWTDPQSAGPVYLLENDRLHLLQANGQLLLQGSIPGNPQGRAHLSGNGNVLYAGYRAGDSVNVFQSLNAGLNWTFQGTAPTGLFRKNSFRCSAHNPQQLFAGAINAFTSLDGGVSWQLINNWGAYYSDPANKLHADIPDFLSFTDNLGNDFHVVCTDGGAYVSYDGLQTVQNISLDGLNVSQYYSTYTYQQNPALIFAGSQDQGFQKSTQDKGGTIAFEQTIQGDFGHLVSGNGGASLWCNYPGVSMYHPFLVLNNTRLTESFPTEGQLWLAPLVADPQQSNVAYLGGGKVNPADPNNIQGSHIVKLTAGPTDITYTELPYNFSSSGKPITAMAISEINPSLWYVMTAEPRFFFSTDGGQNWSSANHMDLPENHYFYGNSILASPNQAGRVYLAGSGYDNPAVYYSLDNGATIAPMDQGLPPTLVYDIASSPDESLLFAATEVGPYVFTASDSMWHPAGGMHAPDQTYWTVEYVAALRAARFGTFGRGIWDLVICDSLSPLQGEFDFDLNLADGLTVKFNNQSDGAYFYHWDFGDGSSSTNLAPNHVFSGSGIYEVELRASNHCFVDTVKTTLNLYATDLEKEMAGKLRLHPNPSQGQFYVRNSGETIASANLKIFNLGGQLVYQETIHSLVSQGQMEMEPLGLSPGLYLVKLTDKEGGLLLQEKLKIE